MADVKGLPPGAVVKPIAGLPPGADVRPIGRAPAFAPASTFPSIPWFKEAAYNLIDRGSNLLPAIGGTTGGLIGGATGTAGAPGIGTVAGGVGGAALGGAAGEAARQLVRRTAGFEGSPQTSLEAAKQIGGEGLKQGAYELAGAGAGRLGTAIAPKIVNSALRVPASVGEHGADVGTAVLNMPKGPRGIMAPIRPATIGKVLEDREATLGENLTSAVQKPGQPAIDMAPAISPVNTALGKTNNPDNISGLRELGSMLRENQQGVVIASPSGKPLVKPLLPLNVSPEAALQARRDVDDLITSWAAKPRGSMPQATMKQSYGAITSGLHSAVPETIPIDKELSSIIPARYYANKTAGLKGITENLMTPKGSSLTTAGAGLGYGVSHTPEGAFLGAVSGRVIPEVLASPTVRVGIARTLNSPVLPGVITNVPRYGEGLMQPTNQDLLRKRIEEQGNQ